MDSTYSHIDLDERRKIARWRTAGLSVEVIAEKLGRHRSTIFREIKRNMFVDKVVPDLSGSYCMTAHSMACARRTKLRKLVRFLNVRQSVSTGSYMVGRRSRSLAGCVWNGNRSRSVMKRSTGSPTRPTDSIAVTSYHREWRSSYFEKNFDMLDPAVKRAKSRKQVFPWSGEQDRARQSNEERAFYAHAAEFGIRSGVTVPIKTANGSMSMFTLVSERPEIDLEREIDAVAAVAAVGQLHARVSFPQTTPTVEDAAWLDPKEATYLRWIAIGMTMEEIADVEGVKYNSVRVKLRETMMRFDVRS